MDNTLLGLLIAVLGLSAAALSVWNEICKRKNKEAEKANPIIVQVVYPPDVQKIVQGVGITVPEINKKIVEPKAPPEKVISTEAKPVPKGDKHPLEPKPVAEKSTSPQEKAGTQAESPLEKKVPALEKDTWKETPRPKSEVAHPQPIEKISEEKPLEQASPEPKGHVYQTLQPRIAPRIEPESKTEIAPETKGHVYHTLQPRITPQVDESKRQTAVATDLFMKKTENLKATSQAEVSEIKLGHCFEIPKTQKEEKESLASDSLPPIDDPSQPPPKAQAKVIGKAF